MKIPHRQFLIKWYNVAIKMFCMQRYLILIMFDEHFILNYSEFDVLF